MKDTKEIIKEIFKKLGADVCGVASVDTFEQSPDGFSPKDIYQECKSVIAFGVTLPKGLVEINPRILYSHFNGSVLVNQVDQIALTAAKQIEEELGGCVVPLPCDGPSEYWDAENMQQWHVVWDS